MKIVAIGDIHGRSVWKEIVDSNHDADKIVFIGDYFDTHENIKVVEQIHNFREIIEFKTKNLDRVVLLVGNHDFHYMRSIDEHYSGYNGNHALDIQIVLHEAIDKKYLQMSSFNSGYLFTHAGVTDTWFNRVFGNRVDIENGVEVELVINDAFEYKPWLFKFTVGSSFSPYGDDITQTPIWVRPRSLNMDRLGKFIQVVGHTTQKSLVVTDSVILIDTLGTSGEYLEIVDDIASIRNI